MTRAFVGIALQTPPDQHDPTSVLSLWQEILARLSSSNASSVSLFWIAAGHTIGDPSAPARDLRDRIADRGDCVALTGMTGAADMLLRTGEVERHFEWGQTNSWGSGIDDRGDAIPRFLLRPFADLQREETLACYREHSEPVGLIAVEGTRLVFCDQNESVFRPVAWVSASGATGEEASTRVRKALRSAKRGYPGTAEPIIVIAAGTPEETIACVQTASSVTRATHDNLIQELFSHEGPAARRARDHARFSRLRPRTLLQPHPASLDAVATLRTRRASKIGTRRILEAAAQTGGHADSRPDERPTGERTIVATMHGEAALEGDGCYTMLDAGRFAGIWPQMRQAARPLSSRSLLFPTGGRERPGRDDILGCVSFETEESRGAVSNFTVSTNEHTVTGQVIYSAVLDVPGLAVVQSIACSTDDPGELLMHGITVDPRELTVSARYGDGTQYTESEFDEDRTLWGEAFEITMPGMQMSIVALNETGAPAPWSLSVRHTPNTRLFIGPQRGSMAAGVVETSSLLLIPSGLDRSTAKKAVKRSLPKALIEEIAETRMVTARAVSARLEA